MLDDVRYACRVLRRRAETDEKHFVVIPVRHDNNAGTALTVHKKICIAVDIRKKLVLPDGICFWNLKFTHQPILLLLLRVNTRRNSLLPCRLSSFLFQTGDYKS